MTDNIYKLDLTCFVQGYSGFNTFVVKSYRDMFAYESANPTDVFWTRIAPRISMEFYEIMTGTDISMGVEQGDEMFEFQKFLISTFLVEDQDKFLGFLNVCFEELQSENHRLNYSFFKNIVTKINSQFFDLDFEFNSEIGLLQKKIDPITTHSINTISKDLEKSNQEIYDKCVSDYLGYSFKTKDNNWKHEQLDNMKEILENIYYKEYSKRLKSNTDELRGVLFDGNYKPLDNVLDFLIKNIHHNETGKRMPINDKQFNYLWLELNKIIYLLLKYKTTK